MGNTSGKPLDLFRCNVHQVQVGNIAIGLHHLGQADIIEKSDHRIDRIDERERKRLQLEHDLRTILERVPSHRLDMTVVYVGVHLVG